MKAFCKFIQITAVIAAGFCITGNAHASGRLVVTLSQPMQRQDAETGIVMIQMENTGDRPVAIFRWKTPFALYDDRLANPQFDVRDASGKMLPYKGRNVKPGPITPDSFIVLEPHQSIRKNVDVASDYGLDNGNYTVAFTIDLQIRPYAERIADTEATQLPINDQTVVSSNTLNIWVNPSLVNARKLAASIISTQGENLYQCDADQDFELSNIQWDAGEQADAAYEELNAGYQMGLKDGHLVDTNNSDARYTYWFGAFNTARPINPLSTDDADSDDYQVANIAHALIYRVNQSLTYHCGCDPAKYPKEVRAWAESDSPYTMNICDSFWDDPENGPVTSQIGTLIHELTHFNDDQSPAAVDYAYGPHAVHQLTISNRSQAVRNADNYEYFFMGTPIQ